ncbi:MAG: flippase activity-associated protein Agl23 [Silvanigrellaceae bacterium]
MSAGESPNQDVSTSSRNSSNLWIWFAAGVAVVEAVSRFLYLSDKPFHHDESLHAYYSHRVSQGFPHEYSALLHGPVLYYFVGAFMTFFGVGDISARLPAAICGVFLVLLPLFWRKRIGLVTSGFISIFLLLSPTFMYFGRFLREDSFNALWMACSLAGFFGYRWTRSPWMAVASSTFLALHFCNKENSYLHVFIWLSAAGAIEILTRLLSRKGEVLQAGQVPGNLPANERIALRLNCIVVFAVVYILFYSSFFRHSKGAMHGVLDGLYRESLLYWWDQNQKRRIDGPFDYHSPLFFNYEFALIPALLVAWYRSVSLAALGIANRSMRFPFTMFRRSRNVIVFALALVFSVLFLPRLGLTTDGCSISEFCLSRVMPGSLSDSFDKLAHLLHFTHTRHFLQILAVALLGAVAVVSSVSLGRRLDAFLWWWSTGAIGIYSYVGEKVPWLLIYILMPLVVLAGLEMGRSLQAAPLWVDSLCTLRDADLRKSVDDWESAWRRKAGRWLAGLTLASLCLSGWKSIRLSFPESANPEERLVFTQTTPKVREIRQRWLSEAARQGKTPKVTMYGDATWPMAWYVHDFPGHDFIKPADAKAAEAFDAFFLDGGDADHARKTFPMFDVYRIPLRHWWVPQPNPTFSEILEYFLTSRPYPRELRSTPGELGYGTTDVLYLENRMPGRFFESVSALDGVEKVASAGRFVESEVKQTQGLPLPNEAERKP